MRSVSQRQQSRQPEPVWGWHCRAGETWASRHGAAAQQSVCRAAAGGAVDASLRPRRRSIAPRDAGRHTGRRTRRLVRVISEPTETRDCRGGVLKGFMGFGLAMIHRRPAIQFGHAALHPSAAYPQTGRGPRCGSVWDPCRAVHVPAKRSAVASEPTQ